MSDQLDLIHLTVSPEEARMLATAAACQALRETGKAKTYTDKPKAYLEEGRKYMDLSAKIDKQRQL